MGRIPVIAVCLVIAGVGVLRTQEPPAPPGVPRFTGDGKLVRPADYREWVFLSSGLGMTYGPAAEAAGQARPMFDNVFVSPAAYRHFQQTGTWPEGTMFVLEVRSSESKASINNGGRFQSELVAIEAEVKREGKWSFYGFGKSAAAVKALPASAACYSCHATHGAVDNTFVQFYPTLAEVAKAKGTWRGE